MVGSTVPVQPLVAFKKVSHASFKVWLTALHSLAVLKKCRFSTTTPTLPMGDIAFVRTDEDAICYLTIEQQLVFEGIECNSDSILVIDAGEVEILQPEATLVCTTGDALVFTDCTPFQLRVHSPSKLALLQFGESLAAPSRPVCPFGASLLVQDFLHQSRFFADHEQAAQASKQLMGAVRKQIEVLNEAEPERIRATIDVRVIKALEFMERSPQWQFDITELASAAGVSERNLYYLMQAETGMTPYRYFQRFRLLRVREQLIDCRNKTPSISRLATKEGFGHLGRFSALYKRHFGELPRETLEWAKRVRKSAGYHQKPTGIAARHGKATN